MADVTKEELQKLRAEEEHLKKEYSKVEAEYAKLVAEAKHLQDLNTVGWDDVNKLWDKVVSELKEVVAKPEDWTLSELENRIDELKMRGGALRKQCDELRAELRKAGLKVEIRGE